MSTINRTRYAILGALFTLGPSSGYAIKRGLETSVANFWHEGFGQIYPMLAELERERLVTSHADATSGARRRTTWALTPQGHVALRLWIAAPIESTGRPRNELLLKLFFAAALPPETATALVQGHREAVVTQLRLYRTIEAEMREEAEHGIADPGHRYRLATLRYGLLTAQAVLAWCDETLTQLEVRT